MNDYKFFLDENLKSKNKENDILGLNLDIITVHKINKYIGGNFLKNSVLYSFLKRKLRKNIALRNTLYKINGELISVEDDIDIFHKCIEDDRILLTRDNDFIQMYKLASNDGFSIKEFPPVIVLACALHRRKILFKLLTSNNQQILSLFEKGNCCKILLRGSSIVINKFGTNGRNYGPTTTIIMRY